ncbi:MAG: hypothetical protein ABGX84_06660 [Alcanivorax sp.]
MNRKIIQIDEGMDLIRFEQGDEAMYCLNECGITFVLGENTDQTRERLLAISAGIERLESSHITAEAAS